MGKSLALWLVLFLVSFSEQGHSAGGPAEGGRSCYGKSCYNKLLYKATCNLALPADLHLRSLPTENSQAVGYVSRENEVDVVAENGKWAFVQSSYTEDGKKNQGAGGWIPRSTLINCRDDRQK